MIFSRQILKKSSHGWLRNEKIAKNMGITENWKGGELRGVFRCSTSQNSKIILLPALVTLSLIPSGPNRPDYQLIKPYRQDSSHLNKSPKKLETQNLYYEQCSQVYK